MDTLLLVYLLNGLLMILMPVGLALVLLRRWKLGGKILLAGAVTFIFSQTGHIPFNSLMTMLLNKTGLADLPAEAALIFNAVFLGLSAGLFEELFRYGMFRWWLKDARSWRKGVLAGVGHGGAEAVIFGGIALLALIQLTAARNMDLSSVYTGSTLELAQQQVNAYWSAPWYAAILGAVERLFAISIQISLAVLVVQGFIRNQKRWLWLAVGYHALVDAVSVYAMNKISIYWVEGIVGGFALLSLAIIFLLKRPEPVIQAETASDVSAAKVTLPEIDPSSENLEKSKYL
jgi:uncharacterized membrane protein YhfC